MEKRVLVIGATVERELQYLLEDCAANFLGPKYVTQDCSNTFIMVIVTRPCGTTLVLIMALSTVQKLNCTNKTEVTSDPFGFLP